MDRLKTGFRSTKFLCFCPSEPCYNTHMCLCRKTFTLPMKRQLKQWIYMSLTSIALFTNHCITEKCTLLLLALEPKQPQCNTWSELSLFHKREAETFLEHTEVQSSTLPTQLDWVTFDQISSRKVLLNFNLWKSKLILECASHIQENRSCFMWECCRGFGYRVYKYGIKIFKVTFYNAMCWPVF